MDTIKYLHSTKHYYHFSGDTYEVQVNFRCSLVGFYPATLAFEFKPDLQPSTAAFHIVRFIEAHCMTALGRELAPVAPYKPRSLPAWTPPANYTIVDGQRPEGYKRKHTLKYTANVKTRNVVSLRVMYPNFLILPPLTRLSVMQLQHVNELKKYKIPACMTQLIQSLKRSTYCDQRYIQLRFGC